jgi:PAS domain S-box-containing protein
VQAYTDPRSREKHYQRGDSRYTGSGAGTITLLRTPVGWGSHMSSMSSPVQPPGRTELTRDWSAAVSPTADVPLQAEVVEERLRAQLDILIGALGQAPFSPEPATEVGANLVAAGFTGEQALGRNIEILGHAVAELHELRTAENLAAKVITLLGALACGYTAALHRRDFEQSEARFREVFDSAPVGTTISRLDGTVTRTNGVLTEILQYPRAELTGRNIAELFHPDDATMLWEAYQGLGMGKLAPFRRHRAKLVAANGDTTLVTMTVLCYATLRAARRTTSR